MIVQCDKCETKFRIADDKVTGGGVKVRCSKCAHVFVVRKDPGLGAPAGTPGLSFGETGATTVKVSPDALQAFGASSSRIPSNSSSRAPTVHMASSRAPTVPLTPPRSIPPSSNTSAVAAALGFGSAPPRAPIPAFSTQNDARPSGLPAFPDSTKRELPTFPGASSNDRFPESRPPSEMKTEQMRLPGAKRDPFHDFGAPPQPTKADPFSKLPSSPGYFPPNAQSNDPFAKISSGSGSGDVFPKLGSDPFGKVPSAPRDNPFLGGDPFGSSPPDAYPVPSLHRSPDPFSDANMLAPSPQRPDSNPFQNPPAPGPDLHQRGVPKSDPMRATFFPPPPAELSGKPRSNVERIVPNDAIDHDPFADIDIEASPMLGEDFQDNSVPPPAARMMPAEPLAKLQFGAAYVPPYGEVSHAKTAVAAAYRNDDEDEEGIGLWPTMLGVAVGLLIALFVFPGLLGDWMDFRIGTELIQPKKLLPESIDQVSPLGARVTSYDGKNGAHMLVVSGSAHNDSTSKLDNIQAVVLMMEGDEIVERRRAFVGVTLDEATLAGLQNAADLETAYRNAKLSAAPEQLEIAPGANARFVVVFPEIPDQIETRKFRVEFVKAPLESAKKTEPEQ